MLGKFARGTRRAVRRGFGAWLRPLVGIVALATAVTFTLAGLGVLEGHPSAQIRELSLAVPTVALVFVGAFLAGGLLWIAYALATRPSVDYAARWHALPLGWRVVAVTTAVTVTATATVLTAGFIDAGISTVHVVGAVLTVAPVGGLLSWRAMRHGHGGRWIRSLVVGAAVAVWAGVVVFSIASPTVGRSGFGLLGAIGTVWLVVTAGTYARSGTDAPTLAVRTGYAKWRRIEPRSVATVLGMFGGATVGVGLGVLGASDWSGLLGYLLAWPLVGAVVYWSLSGTDTATHLEVVEVRQCDDGARELLVENTHSEPVDLTDATLRDTSHDRYRLDSAVTIKRGQCRSFAIPEAFDLDPGEASIELPLGYTLTQDASSPVLYTRDGETLALSADESRSRTPDTTFDPTGSPTGG